MLQKEIGIDLGTVNVLVYVRGAGIVLQEPSVVALTVNESRIVAVGEEARSMLGRTPDAIEVVRPMRDGVIADYQITEAMLRYFIKKATGGVRMFKPKVMISVPFGVTSVESRAVHEAAVAAGGATRDVHLIPEPIAAAFGAGMPVNTPTGNMVLDLGGGTTEAAVVSMNGIVVANSCARRCMEKRSCRTSARSTASPSANQPPKRSSSGWAQLSRWTKTLNWKFKAAIRWPACRARSAFDRPRLPKLCRSRCRPSSAW
jgi:MreB/Mrl family cell shape determining protein